MRSLTTIPAEGNERKWYELEMSQLNEQLSEKDQKSEEVVALAADWQKMMVCLRTSIIIHSIYDLSTSLYILKCFIN